MFLILEIRILMKQKDILLFLLISNTHYFSAQTVDRQIAVGLVGGKTLYVGDYGGNGIFDFGHVDEGLKQGYLSSGLSLTTYLSPSFDLGIQGNYSDYGYWNSDNNNFIAMKIEASVFAHYKFNNGYILNHYSAFSPFLSVGFGMASYNRNTGKDRGINPRFNINDKSIDFIVPVGAGIKYQISTKFAIQYQYLYNFTNSDLHDVHMGGTGVEVSKQGNDAWGEHLLSFIYSFKFSFFHSNSSYKKTPWKLQYEYNDNSWKSHGHKK